MNLHKTATRTLRRPGPALLLVACTIGAASAAAAPASASVPGPGPQVLRTVQNSSSGSGSGAPQNVHVNASGHVTWDPNSVNAPNGFEVQRDYGTPAPTGSWGGWQDPNGTDGTAHTYRIAPIPSAGKPTYWSGPVTQPPLNLKQTNGQVCWNPVAGHTGSFDNAYNLYFDNVSQPQGTSGGATCYTLGDGMDPGVPYWVTVATSDQGSSVDESDQSDLLRFTYEVAPTGLTATASQGGISLSWNSAAPAVNNGIIYAVFRDGVQIDTTNKTPTTYLDKTAQPGVWHTYSIKTVQVANLLMPAGESAPSAPATAKFY
jgi:hypothetical protein